MCPINRFIITSFPHKSKHIFRLFPCFSYKYANAYKLFQRIRLPGVAAEAKIVVYYYEFVIRMAYFASRGGVNGTGGE